MQKFTCCSNSECNSIFPIEQKEKYSDTDFLCSNCAPKLESHHIVQCSNCRSVVNFFLLEEGEEPLVFYTKKCHHCNGSLEDEMRIQPFMYPELFM